MPVPTSEEQLKAKGFDTTEEGLRSALSTSNTLTRVYAVRVIKEKNIKSLIPDLELLLDDSKSRTRAEAAMALAKLGSPRGLPSLKMEMKTSKEQGVKLDVAGALAELGDSSGYSVVKACLLDSKNLGLQHMASHQVHKFSGLKGGADAQSLYLLGMDAAGRQAKSENEKEAKSARVLFRLMVSGLGMVGDEGAMPKLQEMTQSDDPELREAAERALKTIEKRVESKTKK
jgi:HEAT repeat protein